MCFGERIILCVLLVVSMPAFFAHVAEAAWVEKPDIREMACRADLIVHGLVDRQTIEDGFRHNSIQPLRVLKPKEFPDDVAITIRESAYLHSGHPRYREREEVIVFLVKIPESSLYSTMGSSQGKMEVREGGMVGPDASVEDIYALIKKRSCGREGR